MGWKTPEAKRAYNKEYGIKNKERISADKKRYALENKEQIKSKRKQYYQNNKEKHIQNRVDYYSQIENRAKYLLGRVKIRANKSSIEFNLSLEDIIIPEFCPYLGLKLTHDLGKGQAVTNSSIDRIDPAMGYVKGNIQVISRLANTMKSNSSREQREAFANAVLNNSML